MLRTCSRQYVFAHPESERGGTATGENAHGAVGRFKSMLHVKRHPGTALFIFGEGHGAVGVAIPLGAHVAVPRQRAALEILRQQTVGAPDGGVGVIVRRHGAGAGVHGDLVANGTVDDHHRSHRAGGAAAGAHAAGGERQYHRKVLRSRPRHHRVDRYFLDREFPVLAKLVRAHSAPRLRPASGSCARAFPLRFFSVGKTIGSLSVQLFSKNKRCRFSSESESTILGVERSNLVSLMPISLGRPREPFNNFLHYRPAADRALAVDIGPQLFGGFAHHRLGHESVACLRHAVHLGHGLHHFLEGVGMDSDGGHTVLAIESYCVHGDRRRAGASMAGTDDGAVAIRFDHLPSLWIVLGVDARHFDELRRHRGHVVGEPILHLAQKQARVVKPWVDQIQRLAVQAFQPRRHRFRGDLGRITHGVHHRDFIAYLNVRFLICLSFVCHVGTSSSYRNRPSTHSNALSAS